MLTEFILWLMRHSPTARRWLWRTLHQFLGRKFADVHWWTFMNYDYTADGGAAAPLALKAEDEQGRVCAQLYHHIASAIDIAGREVLEVGCAGAAAAPPTFRATWRRNTSPASTSPPARSRSAVACTATASSSSSPAAPRAAL